MALPPEPLDELLPQAKTCIDALVKSIVHSEPQTLFAESDDPSMVDMPRELPAQTVLLTVQSTLFGQKYAEQQEIEVLKPAGDYTLREGIKGYFLLAQTDEGPLQILGRYGPDNYSPTALQAAIKVHKLS